MSGLCACNARLTSSNSSRALSSAEYSNKKCEQCVVSNNAKSPLIISVKCVSAKAAEAGHRVLFMTLDRLESILAKGLQENRLDR
jgi:hypothetical protein